jgi:hypothetical protein
MFDELRHEEQCALAIERQFLEGLVPILNREVDQIAQIVACRWNLPPALGEQLKEQVEVVRLGYSTPRPSSQALAAFSTACWAWNPKISSGNISRLSSMP